MASAPDTAIEENLIIEGDLTVGGRIINSIADYKGIWNSSTSYGKGDMVTYQENNYICTSDLVDNNPPDVSSYWSGCLSTKSYNACFSNSFYSSFFGRTYPYIYTSISSFNVICIAPFPGLTNLGRPIHTIYATLSADKGNSQGILQIIENGKDLIFEISWTGGKGSDPNIVSGTPLMQPSNNPSNWTIQAKAVSGTVYIHAVTVY